LEITTQSLENRQLRLIITMDEEQTQQAMQRAARHIAKQVNIPGFRRGKAPYGLIIQRFGEDTVRQEAADAIVEQVFREAMEQEKIEPYAPAKLEEVNLDPIRFHFTVSLPPTVALGDYRDYRLKPRRVKVPKQEVQETLEEVRRENAILEPVERPAALNDGAEIDLVCKAAGDVTVLQQENARVLLEVEGGEPAPGFIEAVVGMEAGEERTFTLTLPDDFPTEEFRGQEAQFTVTMRQVYKNTLPKLDDDLARTVGNFDSFKALEQDVKERLRQAAQRKADTEYTTQVMDTLLEQAQVEYPPEMLAEELDSVVGEVERAVKSETRLPLEDYLRYRNMTMEDLQEDLKPRAMARLKRALVLGEVVRLEELDVDAEEVDAYIQEMSAPWGVRADEVRASLDSREGRTAMRSRLLADKAVQRLVAIAKGEAPELPAAEEQEGEEAESTGEEGEES
jgi:trigger factor